MHQPINRYRADLRDFQFLLFEQFKVDDILGRPPFADWGRDEIKMVLDEGYRFAREVLGPLNQVGDLEGCRIEDGQVKTPKGFKAAWNKFYEAGWRTLGVAPEFGGQGAPHFLASMVEELMCGANIAFCMYPGLALGAAEVIMHFGNQRQRALYARRMTDGTWGGTMCLTEPHAGSDVGSATSTASRNPDGTYSIKGTKIFISGGDHDMAENIVHLVLARIDGALPGTKGLSLFIVPKYRVGPNGERLGPNDVAVPSIEHKLGINGSATCVVQFGDEGKCVGELVGDAEHQGILQMFRMMNFARIAVGIQGLSVASSAYLNALEYARERKQGSHVKNWKNPEAERVAIIEHPNVRQDLLDMKARVEGIRALITKLTTHQDRATALAGKDDVTAAYHLGQVNLLTPLVKAYSSDQSFRVCETAVQVYGGAGYLRDHPVEQYLRDAKIFSIYEGTNAIQALDLVGRKLGQGGGQNAQAFFADIQKFVAANKTHPKLGPSVDNLAEAADAVMGSAMQFLAWFQAGQTERVPLGAGRFLEMMSELTVGWLLLEQAVLAIEKAKELSDTHPDRAFYEGKLYAAIYFARNVLPSVPFKAKALSNEDPSALNISNAAFGP